MLSERAAETFREKGFAKEKLFYLPRGVDVRAIQARHAPADFSRDFFRRADRTQRNSSSARRLASAQFEGCGALAAWFGARGGETAFEEFWRDNIRIVGFARDVEKYLNQATIHVFPSQLEGSAKVTYEAAACGLPRWLPANRAMWCVTESKASLSAGRCRCHRRCDRAFLPASENRVGNGHCRAQTGGGKFHLGPFSGAAAGAYEIAMQML